MSEKSDKLSQIRLDPINDRRLRALQKKLPVKITLGSLANTAISRGIELVEAGLPELNALKR